MKYYKELAELGCFSQKELVQLLGSGQRRSFSCGGVFEKRICGTHPPRPVCHRQHGDRQPIPTRYQIASKLAEDACISHHSAFEFYGYANQVFYEVYVATGKPLPQL